MRTLLRWTVIGLFLTGLFALSAYGQVSAPPIYWDANTESDMSFYRVYASSAPCTDPAPSPTTCIGFSAVGADVPQAASPISFTDPNLLTLAVPIYYRVTASNTSGLESGFSNELEVTIFNTVPPANPGDPRRDPVVAIYIRDSDVQIFVQNQAPTLRSEP